MAKNEAKIKFTAETGEFNSAIKKSNNEMSELRAEMKLNETQMAGTGKTIDGLEKKHKLLQAQLDAAGDKTNALSEKLKSAEKYFGANSDEASKLRTQLTNARTAQEKLEQSVKACADELEDYKQSMSDAGNEAKQAATQTEKMTDKLDRQERELKDLKDAYAETVIQYGRNSREAKDLAKQIGKLSKEVKDNQTKMGKAEKAAEKLDRSFDNAGDAARKASEGFTVAKGAISNMLSDAISTGIDKVGQFIDYIGGLPEETRESRRNMAVLETAFDEAGLSAEQGKNTVRELYGVLGDNDRAIEASTLIAKMSKNQEDLNSWTKISTGIFGTYGESLPVESLAEAANETAKTGTVTGTLADSLNWSSEAASMFSQYMSKDVTTAEDAFNVALSKCTTEQERQTLITETLTALYGDAAGKYRDSAGGMIEAEQAAYDLAQTESEIAEKVEPVTTAWDGLKNQLLTAALPAIEKVAGALQDGMKWLQEHPAVLNAVAVAFGILAAGLGILAGVWVVYTVAQLAANTAMLPVVGIAVAIIAVIALLVAAGVWLYQNWDTIKAKCSEVWNNVKQKFADAKNAIVGKYNEIKQKTSETWENIKTATSTKIENMKKKVSTVFENIRKTISDKIEKAKTKVKNVIDKIKGFFDFQFSWPSIPMPHFSISPSGWKVGDLLKGSIPKLGIEFYAKGGIMTKPTLFGMNGSNAMIGGEAGPEAILPISKLEEYISNALDKKLGALNLQTLADAIEDLASRPIELNVSGRRIAVATASDTDSVNGLRTTFRSRGLALE